MVVVVMVMVAMEVMVIMVSEYGRWMMGMTMGVTPALLAVLCCH